MKDSNCMKSIIKMVSGSTLVLLILVGLAVLSWGSSVRAQSTGSGTLTINPGGISDSCMPMGTGFMDFDSPHWWDWLQNDTVHINIAPGFMICTSGPSNDINDPCDTAADCSTSNGSCNYSGTCAPGSGACQNTCENAAAKTGNTCTTNTDCVSTGSCTGPSNSKTCNNGAGTCSVNSDCTRYGTCTGSKKCTATSNKNAGGVCTANADCQGKCSANSDKNANGACSTSNGNADCQDPKCNNGSPNNPGGACNPANGNNDCNIIGTCESALECSGETNVIISGHTGNACNVDGDCADTGETTCDDGQTCDVGFCSETDEMCSDVSECPMTGLCRFEDTVPTSGRMGNGAIDVCYTTRENACAQAEMFYCNGTCEGTAPNKTCSNTGVHCNNDHDCEFQTNVQSPNGTGTFIKTFLRTVALGDTCTTDLDCPEDAHCGEGGVCEIELETSDACTPLVPTTCLNEVGSLCCGLTQGAYGAPNSAATAAGTGTCGVDLTDAGYIPAAACDGCNVFDSACDNATTIGLLGNNSVTIKNLTDLITYLPAGSTAGKLKSNAEKCFSPFLNGDLTGGGSKGSGGGVLSGQTMASQINAFLSDECGVGPTGGAESFTAVGFGGFTLPDAGVLVCTQRSGPDKVLGNGDDICQAFGYADCVAGSMVSDVLDCANYYLAHGNDGLNPYCSCSASELNNALSNINVQFDQCGIVVECPEGQMAGTFDCSLL